MAGRYRIELRRSDDADAEQPFHLALVEENGEDVLVGETRVSGHAALTTAQNIAGGEIIVDSVSFANHGIG